MGLERRGGGVYFYRKARRGGRVVSEYMGGGEAAPLMARMDAIWRSRDEARREDRKAARARADAEDARAAEWFARVEAIAREALEAAGYHRHRRGEWRKRRMATDADGRVAIFKRARDGDKESLPALRALFDERPALVEAFGDMAAFAEREMISAAVGEDLGVREGLGRKLAGLRAELAGPDPTPIERLLAERAAFCWMRLYHAERAETTAGSMTLPLAEYHRKRIDSAHRRYLTALKTLATVRKLALPALQVNLANNQVVLGPGAAPP